MFAETLGNFEDSLMIQKWVIWSQCIEAM